MNRRALWPLLWPLLWPVLLALTGGRAMAGQRGAWPAMRMTWLEGSSLRSRACA